MLIHLDFILSDFEVKIMAPLLNYKVYSKEIYRPERRRSSRELNKRKLINKSSSEKISMRLSF